MPCMGYLWVTPETVMISQLLWVTPELESLTDCHTGFALYGIESKCSRTDICTLYQGHHWGSDPYQGHKCPGKNKFSCPEKL